MTSTTRPSRPRPDPSPTPIRIDPRIRKRRIEVKRDEGRKRLHMLLASLGVIGLAVGAVAATRSPLLDVDRVILVGGGHTTATEVVQVARLADHPQMIDVGTAGVAKRVRTLPWVKTATARREWPATIRVHVTERIPAASLPADNGKWAVADATGRVLEVLDTRPMTMPSVSGAAPAGAAGTALGPRGQGAMAVAAALPVELRSRTAEVTVGAGGEVDLRIVPSGIVRLGDVAQLEEKLAAAVTVLTGVDGTALAVLDVRVPRAPVLTRR
jgi:cell division protein FtsQ